MALPTLGFLGFLIAAGALPETPERPTDAIAVLTGGAERLETGLRLLQADRAPRLLVSGAHPDVRLADVVRLAQAAEVERVAQAQELAGRITLGHAAATTRGNAAEVSAWTRASGFASLRVVTAGYHMPRALLELRRALPGVALIPHPVQPAQLRGMAALGQWRTWTLLGGEYLKLIAAILGLGADPPSAVRA